MVFLNLGKMGTLAPSLAFLSLATITWGSVLPRPKFSKLSLTKAETSTEAAIIEFILFNTAETNLKLCTQKGDQTPVCVHARVCVCVQWKLVASYELLN